MHASRRQWLWRVPSNVLAGVTSSFALVPECIAFAMVARVNPIMGLYGAFIICGLTAIFGGRPGMISGAAGSMAVVIVALVVQHGAQYLVATVVLSGLLMVVFGLLRLGKLIRMVPHPVMIGFVNGLAIVIALAQLEQFKVATPEGQAWLLGTPLYIMCALVVATMLIVYCLPRLTTAIPPALVAIVSMGAFTQLAHVPTRTLGDIAHVAGRLPSFKMPEVLLTPDTLKIIFPYAVLMAVVGLLETLLTLNLTDEITETRGRPNRECVALGFSNVISGFFGGMGGCAMIGQTMINLSSGGRSRLSGTISSVMILLIILYLSPLIERIPLAALVGVMLVVSQQTFAWSSLRVLNRVPKNDALIIIAVTIITVFTDLAIAVLCGVVMAALHFSWQHAREIRADVRLGKDGVPIYLLHGTLFFASTARFQELFSAQHDADQVIVDCQHLHVADHSAAAAFETLKLRYQKSGRSLRFANLSARNQRLLGSVGVSLRDPPTPDEHALGSLIDTERSTMASAA